MKIRTLVLPILALLALKGVPVDAAEPPPEKGDAAYYSATLLFNARQYELALPAYSSFITNYPAHPRAHRARFTTGLCYYNLEQYAEAESLFSGVDGKLDSPANEQARFYRGDCLLRMKRFNDADAVLNVAAKTEITEIKLLSLAGLVDSAFLADRWEEAVSRFSALTNAAGSTPSRYTPRPQYQCAAALIKLGRAKEAIPTLTRLLPLVKDQPMEQPVAFLLGEALRMEQEIPEATKAYALAATFTNTPLAIQARFRKAIMQSAAGDIEGAAREFDAFLLMPNTPTNLVEEASVAAGRIAFERKDFEKAEQILRPFSERRPPHPEALLWHARSLMSRELYPQATNLLQSGLGRVVNPAVRPELMATLAAAQIAAGCPDASARTLKDMIQDSPTWPGTPDVVADIALRLHNTNAVEASYAACAAFAAKYPRHPRADALLLIQADNAQRLGRTNEAIFIYTQLRLTSTNEQVQAAARNRSAELRLNQGITHLASREYAAAETALRQLVGIRLPPDREASVQFYLGVALSRQDKWEEAIPLLSRVSEVIDFPMGDQALYELAWCERSHRQPEKAKQHYLSLLERFPQGAIADRATLELTEMDGPKPNDISGMTRLTNLLAHLPRTDRDLRPQTIYQIAVAAMAAGDASNALARFETVLLEYPDLPVACRAAYQAGDLLIRQGDYKQAIAKLELATRTIPGNEIRDAALLRLGESYAHARRWKEAEAPFTMLLTDFPRSEWTARARLGLGLAAEEQKNHEEAIRQYRIIISSGARDEAGAKAQFQMGRCLVALGRSAEALAEFKKTETDFAIPKWAARARLEMGNTEAASGSPARAATCYMELIQKYPESEEATLAKALIKGLQAPNQAE